MSALRLVVDLDTFDKSELRLYRNTEYVFTSSEAIFVSTSGTSIIPFSGAIANGTTEVTFIVDPAISYADLWVYANEKTWAISFEVADRTLALHMEDFTPAYISEEYPLFKKLMEYYFLYTGLEFKPSDLIHNLEKYADIDTTFDEFKESIYKEVLSDFPSDMVVDKDILAKYVLQFYAERGTEDSFRFLFRVLYGMEIEFTQGRKHYLIASDPVQGILSDPNIVLQDNYFTSLYSYVIDIDVPFYQWKDILYKLVNPSGYLPFGRTTVMFSGWDNDFADVEYVMEQS